MPTEGFTNKSDEEMSTMNTMETPEDGLPAADTMESFLERLHGLGKGNQLETTTENIKNSHSDELSNDNLYDVISIGEHEEEIEVVVFQEYLSSKSKIQKTAVANANGHSGVDLKQILLPTSIKRVSVPSILLQSSCEKVPPKSASILLTSTALTKMQSSSFIQVSRISKGSTILRSASSTWMTKAPKSAEKSFPNCTRYVIDTSIMRLKPDFENFGIHTDKELEKIIKSANPKINSYVDKLETNVVRTDVKQSVNAEIGTEHSNAHKPTTNNTEDTADTSKFRLLHRPRALASYKSDCQNISGIEIEIAKLFTYLSKPHTYEFHINKMLRARRRIRNKDIPAGISVNMSRMNEMDDDNVFDIASFFLLCTRDRDEINKRNTDDVFDLGSFFEHDEGMNKNDLAGMFVSNVHELNASSQIQNLRYENDLEATEEVYENSVNLIDASMVDSYINTEGGEETVEGWYLTETAATGVDGILDFGEDSLFEILGVFCRSGLHAWDNCLLQE